VKCIAFLSPAWPASAAASGIATYVDAMAYGMCIAGWGVDVVTGKLHEITTAGRVRLHTIEGPSFLDRVSQKVFRARPDYSQLIARTFQRAVQGMGINVIEMEESFGWATSVVKAVSVPVIVRLHGPWFLTGATSASVDPKGFAQRVVNEGEAIRLAAGVTAPSQYVLDATRRYYQIPLPNARVIPNPASLPSISNRTLETDIPPAAQVILYIGRFEPLKGGDLAIEAFAKLAERNPTAHFVFIGPDNGAHSALHCDVTTFVAKHFASDALHRFHFLGLQTPDTIYAWRSRAAIVIVTSRFESFSLATTEAMSQGCPVVATAVGGIPEIVQDEVNGLLVSPQSEDIAKAVQRLLDTPALATQMARQASIDVAARYGVEKVVSQTSEYYDYILKATS
jgi:glycosyltransferase involved in cell wall biosynthesis